MTAGRGGASVAPASSFATATGGHAAQRRYNRHNCPPSIAARINAHDLKVLSKKVRYKIMAVPRSGSRCAEPMPRIINSVRGEMGAAARGNRADTVPVQSVEAPPASRIHCKSAVASQGTSAWRAVVCCVVYAQ